MEQQKAIVLLYKKRISCFDTAGDKNAKNPDSFSVDKMYHTEVHHGGYKHVAATVHLRKQPLYF